MSTMYSIGAVNQLADALEKAGFSPEDVTKLKQFKDLNKIKDVVSGIASIAYPEHLINCDTNPFIPDGWSLEEHQKGGLIKFDPKNISLYLSKRQKKGRINGHDLRQELMDQPVMNANVLDYLLAHPELIPTTWKDKYIFFWGTIYRNSDGDLCVRCLVWYGSGWGWDYGWLVSDFDSDYPAALASGPQSLGS